MKRRNFLGYIPSISAIPFVAREVVKTDAGIYLEKPEIITDIPIHPTRKEHWPIKAILLDNNDNFIGEGYLTHLSITSDPISVETRDSMHTKYMGGPIRAEFSGELNGGLLKYL